MYFSCKDGFLSLRRTKVPFLSKTATLWVAVLL
jgi:hypothetical protein